MARPLIFKTPEELQEKIDAYFEECDNYTKQVLVKNKEGAFVDYVKYPKPYTVEGLAAFLDVDRHTLNNYEKRDEFFTTIKNARAKILADLQERALMGDYNAAISIFNLKNNYGYEDKQKTELTGADSEPLDFTVKIIKSERENPIDPE